MTCHLALLHRDTRDLLEQVAGVAAGDGAVVLACRPGHREALAALFDGRQVIPADRPDIHTRPAAALTGYHRFTDQVGDGPVTVIVEPDAGSTGADWVRAARLEAAIDLTFAGSDVSVVCAYPASTPPALLARLLRSHPHRVTRHGPVPNADHTDPAVLLHELSPQRPPAPPPGPARLHISGSTGIRDLDAIRRQVTAHLGDVPTLVRTDFVAAVNEILTNAYAHGAPPVGLTLWSAPGAIECRVTDHGAGRPDPTLGYCPRPDATRAGAGLWLARQTCDDIDTWRGGDTFTVRAMTTVFRDREHGGAIARAETARSRTVLFADRAASLTRR